MPWVVRDLSFLEPVITKVILQKQQTARNDPRAKEKPPVRDFQTFLVFS